MTKKVVALAPLKGAAHSVPKVPTYPEIYRFWPKPGLVLPEMPGHMSHSSHKPSGLSPGAELAAKAAYKVFEKSTETTRHTNMIMDHLVKVDRLTVDYLIDIAAFCLGVREKEVQVEKLESQISGWSTLIARRPELGRRPRVRHNEVGKQYLEDIAKTAQTWRNDHANWAKSVHGFVSHNYRIFPKIPNLYTSTAKTRFWFTSSVGATHTSLQHFIYDLAVYLGVPVESKRHKIDSSPEISAKIVRVEPTIATEVASIETAITRLDHIKNDKSVRPRGLHGDYNVIVAEARASVETVKSILTRKLFQADNE